MRKKRKQRRSFQNLWRAMAVLLVLLLVGLGVYFGLQQRRSHTAINEAGEAVTSNITYVMIMGVDARDDDVGRSDTLMVAALDTAQKKAALLSIPRDTRVPIEGHGDDKINHAYAFGPLYHRQYEGIPETHRCHRRRGYQRREAHALRGSLG